MVSLPDADPTSNVLGSQIGDLFHVVASWRQDDGSVYVYAASTLSSSSAAAERWARAQMLMDHDSRGEPDVVSVMTHQEWDQMILDVRRRIGD